MSASGGISAHRRTLGLVSCVVLATLLSGCMSSSGPLVNTSLEGDLCSPALDQDYKLFGASAENTSSTHSVTLLSIEAVRVSGLSADQIEFFVDPEGFPGILNIGSVGVPVDEEAGWITQSELEDLLLRARDPHNATVEPGAQLQVFMSIPIKELAENVEIQTLRISYRSSGRTYSAMVDSEWVIARGECA